MAKKEKLTTDEMKPDDDLNFPEFSFDAGDVPDDRSPTGKLADAVKGATKDVFTDPATYAKFAKTALPKEYGQAADSLIEVADGAVGVYKDAVDTIKPVAGQLATATEKLVPDRFKRVKAALNKVTNWSQGDWKTGAQDMEKQKEAALQMQLAAVFEQQQQQDAEKKADEKVEKGVELIRHRDQVTLLNAIANSVNRFDQYQSRVGQAFQRKSLELQFRSYGVLVDTLTHLKVSQEYNRVRLDAVVKNTGLPDFVKLKNTEAAKEILRNKFINNLQNRAGNLFNRGEFTKNLMANIRNQVKSVVQDVSNVGSSLVMPLEMANLQAELGMGPSKGMGEMGAEMVTKSFLGKHLDRAGAAARDKLDKTSAGAFLRKHAATLNNLQNQGYVQGKALDFVRDDEDVENMEGMSKLGGKFRNTLREFGRVVMPSTQMQTKLDVDSASAARMPAAYSNQAQKSITEIIPGFLARILREIRVLRTGDENTPLIEYDLKKNAFSTAAQKAADLKADVVMKKDQDELSRFALGGLQELDEGGELSMAERKVLAEFLIRKNVSGNGTMDVKTAINPETFYGPLAGKHADKFADFFKKAFDVDEKGRVGSDAAAWQHSRMLEWFHKLGGNFQNVQKKLQDSLNVGDYEAVRSTGTTTEKGDAVDPDKLLDVMVQSLRSTPEEKRTADSDVNVKNNIQKIRPLSALDSIRKIGTSLWNYKDDGKAANGGKPQIGPMAQDVNKVMGSSFAPQGKKIDLVNMNGLNMSGIIDVDKKVDENTTYMGQAIKHLVSTQQMLTNTFKDFAGEVTQRFGGMKGMDTKFNKDKTETPQEQMLRHVERIAKNTEESLVLQAIGNHGITKGEKLDDIFRRLQRGDLNLPANASVARRLRAIGMNLSSLGITAGSGLMGIAGQAQDYVQERGEMLMGYGKKGWNKLTGGKSLKEIATQGKISIQHAKDELFEKFDLYVEGEVKPRLLSVKLAAGDYRSKATGKVIKTLQDIDSDIIDENGNIVLTVAQLKNTYYKTGVAGKVVKAGKWFLSTINSAKEWVTEKANSAFEGGVANLRKAWETIRDLADYPRDVFVRGEMRPRLLGVVMRNGGYLSQTTGKVLRRPGEIDGPITDHQGQVLITTSDMTEKGLVDLSGATIQTGFLRVTGLAVKGITGGFAFGKALFRKGRDLIANAANSGMDNMGRFFDKLTDGLGFGGKQGIDLLTEIRNILDERLTSSDHAGKPGKPILGDKDGDGVRDNSYTDKQKKLADKGDDGNKNNDGVKERANANTPTQYATRNTFDIIAEKMGALKSGIGSALGTAAEVAGAWAGGRGARGEQVGPPKPKGKIGRAMDAVRSRAGALPGMGKLAAGKTAALTLLKKIPGIGLVAGGADAVMRLAAGDKTGAMMALASGGASMLPGPGTAASVGLDAALMARDAGVMPGVQAPGTIPPAPPPPGAATAPSSVPSAASTAASLAGDVAGSAAMGAGGAKAASTVAGGGRFAGATKRWGGLKYLGKAAMLPVKAVGAAGSLGVKGLGLAATGAGMLGKGVMTAARFAAMRVAAPLLMNVAMPLLGAIFSPVGIAVMGAAAVGYGAYKLYKWATKKEFKDIERLRFIQYGLNNGDDDYFRKIYELEQLLEPMVKIDGDGTANLQEKEFDKDKFLSIFGIDPNDKDNIDRAAAWLENRFKPVFLTHVAAMKSVTGEAKLDKMGSLSKADKLKLLPMVSMPSGPWSEMNSPFPEFKRLPGDASLVSEAVSWVRKQLEKLKDEASDGTKKRVEAAAAVGFKSSDSATGAKAEEILPKKETSFFDKVAEKFTAFTGFNLKNTEESTTKVALAKASVESPEVVSIRADSLSALQAVRFKTYGLKKTAYNDVLSLNYLEDATIKEMRFMGNKKVMWVGDIAEVAKKAARFFEFTGSDEKRMTRWTQWFMGRFLPVYTAYLSEVYQRTGKTDKLSGEGALTSQQSLEIANMLVTMTSCWRVTDLPWADGEMNTDPSSCDENIQFLKKQVKDQELAQERAAKESKDPVAANAAKFGGGGSTGKPAAATDEPKKETYEEKRKRLMVNSPLPETGGVMDMPAGVQEAKSDDQLKKERDSRLSGIPLGAGGEMSKGSEASKWMELRNYQGGKANVEGLNPAMKKNLFGLIQEYGEKTGRKVGINRGFVTREQQETEYKKNPKLAAKPGASLHEFGFAVDIDRVTLNEMDSMGLLKKYGFTRPVGGEPWHLEPAGIQANRQAVKKDPEMGTKLIEGGVGKGGGGFGTVDGAAQGATNPELANRILNAGNDNKTDAAIPASSAASDAKVVETGGAQNLPAVQKAANDAVAGLGSTNQRTIGAGTLKDVRAPQEGSKGYKAMQGTIEDAAKITGVDPVKLASTMGVESGFNPNAQGTGKNPAQGLGQFKPGTWKDMVTKYGSKYGIDANTSPSDPRANAIMTGLLMKENETAVSKYKPNPTEGDVYSNHLMGQAGAKRFHSLKDGDYPADTMTSAAQQNPQLYYKNGDPTKPRTKSEMMALFDNKMAKVKGDFGITGPVQTAQAPAANDSGFMKTSLNIAPREVKRQDPTPVIAPNIAPVIGPRPKVMNSADVPQVDLDRAKLVTSVDDVKSILQASHETQKLMLQALQTMVSIMPGLKAPEGEPEVKPAIQKRDPEIVSHTPNRNPRTVTDPVIPMKHRTVL